MADITNLENFLTDVAGAIKEKTGKEEKIPAANFDSEIRSIETGIDTSDANATAEYIAHNKTAYVDGKKISGLLRNGSSDGHTATEVDVIDNMGEYDNELRYYTKASDGAGLSTKGEYYLANESIAISAPFSKVANILQIKPEQIVKGNTILGVKGTAESGGSTDVPIKLFSTVKEMNADSNIKEGDLAVVYDNTFKDVQNGESIYNAYAYLPKTVTLSEPITERLDINYSKGNGSISPTSMYISAHSGSLYAQYSSEDGITYTKTDSSLVYLSSGNTFSCSREDVIPAFIKTASLNFEGLYEATTHSSNYKYNIVKCSNLDSSNKFSFIQTGRQADKLVLYKALLAAHKQFPSVSFDKFIFYLNEEDNVYIAMITNDDGNPTSASFYMAFNSNGEPYKGVISNAGTKLQIYEYISDTDELNLFNTSEVSYTYDRYKAFEISNMETIPMYSYMYNDTGTFRIFLISSSGHKIGSSTWSSVSTSDSSNIMPDLLEYWYCNTQLSSITPTSLLENYKAYGNIGVVSGDGTIYNNLDIDKIQKAYISDELFDEKMNISYDDFISSPTTDQCGLYGIEFAGDNVKFKTIKDGIANITSYETVYSDKIFINPDNSLLSLVNDGNDSIKLIANYKNYNLYFVRVLEDGVKVGKILVADNNNNVVDSIKIMDSVEYLPYIICCAIDETHYNAAFLIDEYNIQSFKIDFSSSSVKDWLSTINSTIKSVKSSTSFRDRFGNNNSSMFGRWMILTGNKNIVGYDFDTNEFFKIYSNSTTDKIRKGVNYVKDDIFYYNDIQTQFSYDLITRSMIQDASKKYIESIVGDLRVQIDDDCMHVCYSNQVQWKWDFSTHKKIDESVTITSKFPVWNKSDNGEDMTTIITPDVGKIIEIDDTYEIVQYYDNDIYIHDKITDVWTSLPYFKYLFGEIKYFKKGNTTKYYVDPHINNDNPQMLVWLYYEKYEGEMGMGERIDFKTKVLRTHKLYDLQALKVSLPISQEEYNTALDTAKLIKGGTE